MITIATLLYFSAGIAIGCWELSHHEMNERPSVTVALALALVFLWPVWLFILWRKS